MMDKLRQLWELIDANNIGIRARGIRSSANVRADKLSRETNKDDWRLNSRIFTYMDSLWGPHSIDKFATQGNTQLPRHSARCRDPTSKAVDYFHLPDRLWSSDTNKCNPPWALLPDLVRKLRLSGVEATFIAPY
jgi:hypothetical protein